MKKLTPWMEWKRMNEVEANLLKLMYVFGIFLEKYLSINKESEINWEKLI